MTTKNNPVMENNPLTTNLSTALSRDADVSDLFHELTLMLRSRFEIDKGVLVLRRSMNEPFSAISTWNEGELLDGLTIQLPSESSLFSQVAENRQVYSENYCGTFSGNFFERKLLIDDDSKSFVIQPLISDDKVIGLIGYSSADSTAFTTFEGDDINSLTRSFADMVCEKIDEIPFH